MAETTFNGNVLRYFSLIREEPVMGGRGIENRRQIVLYVGVAAGAVAKAIYDWIQADQSQLSWANILGALIVSFVVFPQLYYTGGLNKVKLSFAHFALAFQNGFFWSVAFNQIAAQSSGS